MSYRFGHFKQLDGWRGLSIILVLIGHTASYSFTLPTPYSLLGNLATLGVSCFFILSGFLITGLLCEEQSAFAKISLRSFYMRRVLRIIPAYYLMLSVTGVLIACGVVTDTPWYALASSFAFLRNLVGRGLTLGHTWSLALEEQFYLLWPLTLSHLNKVHRVRAIIIACLIVATWRAVAIATGLWTTEKTFRPDFRVDGILIGCLIALLRADDRPVLVLLTKRSPPSWALFCLLVAWSIFASDKPGCLPIYLTVEFWLAGLLMVNLIVEEQSVIAKAFTHPILRWFGKLSYSIYLWQQLFIVATVPYWGRFWGTLRDFPFCLVSALLAGVLSYYLVEKPILKLKSRFAVQIPEEPGAGSQTSGT